jgi:hypothetical protein
MFRINHPIAVNITNKCGLVKGYTNVLKIDLKCPEKYIKAYIFFFTIQWIEFKFENLKYISIYLTNIDKKKLKKIFLGGNNLT